MATYWENSCSFGLRYVSWYKYLIVSLFFSHLGFWSGNLFLIAPFPDLCLLVPFNGFHGVAIWQRMIYIVTFAAFQCETNFLADKMLMTSREISVKISLLLLLLLRMFAANEKVFKLFFQPPFVYSKVQHKTFESKIRIG